MFQKRARNREQMPSGIKDVAKCAGVSVATVSHVLNRTRYVAPQTEQRVLKVVQDLKYYKNAHARRLARGHSDFFGLIISDIENPFFPELIKSFETEAVKQGFDLLLCATNYDAQRAQAIVRMMIENMVRGVAVMTVSVSPAIAAKLKESHVPVVFLGLGLVQPYVSNIRVGYATGTAQAIEYLCGLGHRNFAFIAGPQDHPSSLIYQDAFKQSLGLRRLAADRIVIGNNTVEGAAEAVRRLITQPDFPTAVLCSDDITAIGSILALQQAGLRVPEDVSVVGSDDIQLARLWRPSLTTIRLPRDAMGKLAFTALETMLHLKRRPGAEYVLETQLVVRQSTAPPRDHKLQPLKLTT
jgi:DNA-binding LacI/PurR family transcriptional regulator